jgi:DNA gyrase subunit A
MSLKAEDNVSDLFVANTHTPMLFFTSRGIVHKLKVWRLPQGTPQTRGKALVNLLPLEEGETISTVMPMPEDEGTWGALQIVFATSKGGIRRNKLSDFQNIRANGLIAMKLEEEGESLIAVRTCGESDDVLLATRLGRCIRFDVADVRVFSGRTSTGVRGIKLAEGDEVIGMSILHHTDYSADERAAYLKQARELRRAEGEEADDAVDVEAEPVEGTAELSPEQFAEMQAREQMILTVSEQGYGKRTSAYEYRLTGRGGQGIWNMDMGDRNKAIAAVFPINETDQLMMVSDSGQVIRMPVHDIRLTGRKSKGVTLFRLSGDERVVSVARLEDDGGDAGTEGGDDAATVAATDQP